MKILMPLMRNSSLETTRKWQNRVGELMEARFRREVLAKDHEFELFSASWMIPKDERRQGVILYLHGGGYTCGDLEFAKGFGSMLAQRCGVRVFCAGYRLAPEHRYPAALEDAVTAYRYLLDKGYGPEHITVCGESAGGGLCYALCMKCRELGLPMPGAVMAISPWTDMTASGSSYEENKEIDPSMTLQLLSFFADSYCDDRLDPCVSPLFGDLTGMPPSLIFVGGDEIMRSDSQLLHEKLLSCGCQSRIVVKPERWHGYVLYGLAEDSDDFETINRFLSEHLSEENKLRWMRLDNAAKIYPSARRENWSNVYRLSVTLTEQVDKEVLQSALDVTVRRFPSIAARLRRGVFWYYIQQISEVPKIMEENSFPLAPMSREETRTCALRVIVYQRRIALEVFHSLTDGSGALIFLKSLIAEYLQQKHGLHVPAEHGVVGRLEEPSEEELEDSFLRYAGPVAKSRKENDAWQIQGTPEPDDFRHVTCFKLDVREVLAKAHEYNVRLTVFLAAVMMKAIENLQRERIPDIKKRKHVRLLIPCNLRSLFPSRTLRNFSMYSTPELDPRLGEYSFREICGIIQHTMGLEINAKHMGRMIATNVGTERMLIVKVMPLFIKNMVMKLAFNAVGERKSCLSMSNLGAVRVPKEMEPFIERFDVILSIQANSPYNCGVLSYRDTLYVNFIRNIREPQLEYHFHCVLRDLGIVATVESNLGQR